MKKKIFFEFSYFTKISGGAGGKGGGKPLT
jgi:hypothetical protein